MSESTPPAGTIAGHPRGLMVLFGTEMWERFSFYGMRAILYLYMTLAVAKGGMGFDEKWAIVVYTYFSLGVYAFSIPAGLIADRWLGHWNAVLVGGIGIALGQFCLAMGSLPLFYTGLALIMMGSGLLKPNCTLLVGRLYRRDDPRRDAAFSIYYMGINIGAFMAPLACGFLAQNATFVNFLGSLGLTSANGWRWAFSVAGIGMILGLIQFVVQRRHLVFMDQSEPTPAAQSATAAPASSQASRLLAMGIMLIFAILFIGVFEQAGTTLTRFAEYNTDRVVLGWEIPSTWLPIVNPLVVILCAPLFSLMWVRLGTRQPSAPIKFALGLFCAGASMLLLVGPSAMFVEQGIKVAPWWLAGTYFIQTLGELCLSPVGLSLTSRLAPPRWSGMMMGVWLACIGLGNFVAGKVAENALDMAPSTLFLRLAIVMGVAGLVLVILSPKIRRLAGDA
jgi:proton-dependent oligopeptide transporter, POT family